MKLKDASNELQQALNLLSDALTLAEESIGDDESVIASTAVDMVVHLVKAENDVRYLCELLDEIAKMRGEH